MRRPRILVVDDDPVLLDVLRTVIEKRMELDCDVTQSGKGALEAFAQHTYDLVITDALMPEMTGLELLSTLKSRFPDVDVMVMTGFTNEFSYLEVIRAGGSDYIPKPLAIHEIEAKISRVLRERTVLQELLDRNQRLEEDVQHWNEDAAKLASVQDAHQAQLPGATDLLLVLEEDGKVRECNALVTEVLGIGPGGNLLDCVPVDTTEVLLEALSKAKSAEASSFRIELLGKNKTTVLARDISMMPLAGKRRKPSIHVVLRDSARRLELERRFDAEKDRMNALYNSKPDALLMVEKDNSISYMNGPAREILEELGVQECDHYHASLFRERRKSDDCIVGRTFASKEAMSTTATGVSKYGEVIFWEERTIPIFEGSEVARIMYILRDITALREIEAELRMLSVKDTLTDLFNRRHFCEVLEREMHRAQRQRSALCLMLLDVDGFKDYNDKHGHVAGDEVLIQLGEMIKDCIREHVDSACRLGGDEFTVVLPQTSVEQGRYVAERLREKFAPFKEKGLTLSIGVASYGQETRVEDFVDRVDKAMYQVKHHGKDAINVV